MPNVDKLRSLITNMKTVFLALEHELADTIPAASPNRAVTYDGSTALRYLDEGYLFTGTFLEPATLDQRRDLWASVENLQRPIPEEYQKVNHELLRFLYLSGLLTPWNTPWGQPQFIPPPDSTIQSWLDSQRIIDEGTGGPSGESLSGPMGGSSYSSTSDIPKDARTVSSGELSTRESMRDSDTPPAPQSKSKPDYSSKSKSEPDYSSKSYPEPKHKSKPKH